MRFEHILFATDFSEHSLALAAEAEWLANRFQSKLTLIHVLEIPAAWFMAVEPACALSEGIDDLTAQAQRELNAFRIAVPEDRVTRILRHGDPASEIAEYVSHNRVDLVVMGTHGYGPVRMLLSGSVLGKTLHDVPCSVWTAAPKGRAHAFHGVVRRILCALELTTEALPVLQFTAARADAFSAQARVVHAIYSAETRPNKYFDFDLQRYLMEMARIDICKLQRTAHTDFPVNIGAGSIAEAVAEAAAEYDTDLLVIGRGKSQSTLGQVRTHAYDIIRRVPCPVLSYGLLTPDRISSFCIAEHPGQFAAAAPPRTGFPTT